MVWYRVEGELIIEAENKKSVMEILNQITLDKPNVKIEKLE